MKHQPLIMGHRTGRWVAVMALLVPAMLCRAVTYTVNTTSDTHAVSPATSPNDSGGHVSLRSAVEAANAQTNTTTISLPAGTYSLALGEIDLAPNGYRTNSLLGNGPLNTIISQTDPTNRVFNIDSKSIGATVTTFAYLTIQGGHDGADYLGGAGILAGSITATPADVLNLNDCVVQNNHCLTNTTAEVGGGIQMAGGNLNLNACTFANNTSGQSFGGGIFMLAQTVVSSLTATNCLFVNNSLANNSGAEPDGGGAIMIATPPGSAHNLVTCTFTNNSVQGYMGDADGGAIQINGGALNISTSTFVNNATLGPGGSGSAIFADAGTMNVGFSRLTGNAAPYPGVALYNHGSNGALTYATNDWWGCDGGPGAAGCDLATSDSDLTLFFSPWLFLTNTASPATINLGQAATLTASVLQNSAGQSLTIPQIAVLLGLPVTWNDPVDGGISSAQNYIGTNGQATATFTNNNTCGLASANVELDNAMVTATLLVQCPDLTLAKTNNVDGTIPLGNSWTWTLHVANAGPVPASFGSGNIVAFDNLPTAGIAYGTPTIANISGVSGTLVPGLDSNTNLMVAASGAVTLAAGASFDLNVSATPATSGTFGNPRLGGVCVVNPNNNVPEASLANNFASNSVVVTCPVITATPSGDSSICLGNSAIVTVAVSGGTPPYSVTLDNGGGTQTGPGPLFFTVSPAATTTYQISSGADAGSCPISNNGSAAATVTVSPALTAPVITLSPASVLANSAGNHARGPAGLAGYAWTISNGAITGPTNLPVVTFVAANSNNVVLGLTVDNASGCSAGSTLTVPIITGFSVHTNVTFADALSGTSMTMAFDGTNYWSCSGGTTSGARLASYGLSGANSATYSPGLDFRSVTTMPNGYLLARGYNSGVIYSMTNPGVLVPSGITLTGGALSPQSSLVLNGAGTEFDAMTNGVVSRWSTNGTYLGTVGLAGYGSLAGENTFPQNRGLAAMGNLWLTYNGTNVVSVWDTSGNRVTRIAVPGAGTSFDSDFSFSYCNGKVFIVDVAGGTWRGFDLFGGASVAVLAAEAISAYNADVTNKILGAGSLPSVNFISAVSPAPVPMLAQLRGYQAVLVFSDNAFSDQTGMGNLLANYIDQGGGVVVQTFAFFTNSVYALGGRLSTNGYLPFSTAEDAVPASLTLVAELPQSPLLDGVVSFNGGTDSFQNTPLIPTAGSTLVAEWSNGQPLVGGKDDRPGRCAGLNFFPPSSDAFTPGWVSTTSGAQLMADALLWSGRIPPAILAAPANQALPPGAVAGFKVFAAGTSPLSYQWRLNGGNIPSATNSSLAVTVQTASEGAYSVVVSNIYGATTSLNALLNPQLRFLPPEVFDNAFSLFLADTDGSPVATNRAARVSLYATTNLASPWLLLTNTVVPSGNDLRADGFSVTNGFSQFFRAVEVP